MNNPLEVVNLEKLIAELNHLQRVIDKCFDRALRYPKRREYWIRVADIFCAKRRAIERDFFDWIVK